MKKIFMIMLCALLLFAVPTVAFADSGEATETEENLTITEQIVNYITGNAEEILTMVAALASAVIVKLIGGKLSSSVGTLNNNAISIAKEASDKLDNASKKLEEYEGKMLEFMSKLERSEEEKRLLETNLNSAETFLETAKMAVVNLADELAELLLLANIPNAKKEEIYSMHQEAMKKLKQIEGVINND